MPKKGENPDFKRKNLGKFGGSEVGFLDESIYLEGVEALDSSIKWGIRSDLVKTGGALKESNPEDAKYYLEKTGRRFVRLSDSDARLKGSILEMRGFFKKMFPKTKIELDL